MLWKLRNRYIETLTKNGVSLEKIKKMLKNADEMELFNDNDGDDSEFLQEQEADLYCLQKERKSFIKENVLSIRNKQIFEYRASIKRKELVSLGLIDENKEEIKLIEENVNSFRYGRNKLHEAIILRDINAVKMYAQDFEMLSGRDNNNLTPIELAYYENFTEAHEFLEELCEKELQK